MRVCPDRQTEMSRGSAQPARLSIYLLLISRLSPIFTLGVFPLTCPVCSPVLPPAHPLPLFALCSWCSAAPAGYFCQQSSAWSSPSPPHVRSPVQCHLCHHVVMTGCRPRANLSPVTIHPCPLYCHSPSSSRPPPLSTAQLTTPFICWTRRQTVSQS